MPKDGGRKYHTVEYKWRNVTMNVADRIQNLRRIKGISQEELADKIGVSRQAVSKWESEQSVPDIDKIIIMSEYFDVTTDYILRGIENEKPASAPLANASIFVVVATALIFIGLIVACATWYEEQNAMAVVSGLIFMAVGCMVFGVGYFSSSPASKAPAKRIFWMINIWLIAFIPLSVACNAASGGLVAPYPLLHGNIFFFALFGIIYIVLCLAVTLTQKRKR